jgi:hypothetical protein
MVEPIIRMKDIAWIRLRSPDLDLAEQFLRDFGLLTQSTAKALYMHGAGAVHHVQIARSAIPRSSASRARYPRPFQARTGFRSAFRRPLPCPAVRPAIGSARALIKFH